MMRVLARALPVLLALPACSATGPFPVHEKTGIGVRGLALESLQSTRDDPGRANDHPGLDASGFGVQAESFLDADTSVTFHLLRRVYESPGSTVRAIEYREGIRHYFLADQPVQPFLTGLILVSALDGADPDHLSWGIGAGGGGGVAAWITRQLGVEAAVLYEGQVVDFAIRDTADGTEFDNSEVIYGFSFEVQVGVFF